MKGRFLYRAWKARWRDQGLEIEVARAFTRPGDLVVDAGANKGAYLYWLRRFTGETGIVLAFEPQPELATYLRDICVALHWQNTHVNSVALSHRTGKAMLHVPGAANSPGASLESSVLEQTSGNRLECLVDTLDHQLQGRSGLKFLKVDVEGHELALFQGAVETLRKDKPPLLFECEARHLSKHSMQDVFRFLQERGYEGYLLGSRSLLPLARFDPAVHQARHSGQFWNAPGYFNNFLFVARALPADLRAKVLP